MFFTVAFVAALAACEETPMQLANQALERGDYLAAIEFYEQASKKAPLDKTIKISISDARLRYAKQFAIDAVRGAHESPADWVGLMLELEKDPDVCRMELLDAYYTLAGKYRKAGKWDAAYGILLKAMDRDPSRRIAFGQIDDLISADKDTTWGKNSFQKIWSKNQKDVGICMRYARFLGTRELYAEAIALYEKCIGLKPDDFDHTNFIKMEISTLERRKKTAEEKISPQPGAPLSGMEPDR